MIFRLFAALIDAKIQFIDDPLEPRDQLVIDSDGRLTLFKMSLGGI